MDFRNSLRSLGLAGIVASGIFGSGIEKASAQQPLIFIEPAPSVIVCPPIIVVPQTQIVYPAPIFVTPRVESICFDLPTLEPGEYVVGVETTEFREGVGFYRIGHHLGGPNNTFMMYPVTPGRIIPNSKQRTSWSIKTPGHYEISISGNGRRHRIGCDNFKEGDKITFAKISQPFDESYIIKPHPYEPGKMWIVREVPVEETRPVPMPQPYFPGPRPMSNPRVLIPEQYPNLPGSVRYN